jgi:IBR domain, a half RING-finger domain/Zinc finger, C3HC4 type (RING finger)
LRKLIYRFFIARDLIAKMSSKSCVVTHQLAEDAASLTRVRNRFSKANDQQLPKIMTGLLPKLMKRLEDYSQASNQFVEEQNGGTPAVDSLTHLRKAQQDIHGIFATALERIRGNQSISVDTLMPALLPFVGSINPVVGTWTLALLQAGINRMTIQSLDPKMVAVLIESLGVLHHSLLTIEDDAENHVLTDAAVQALESRWIQTSWLLMDSIMILSGYKPLLDWDAEHFDPKQHQQVDVESSEYLLYESARSEAAEVLSNPDSSSAAALVSLLLDLILFWPDCSGFEIPALSPLALKRMNHRSKMAPPIVNDQDAEHHLAQVQRQRQRREPHPGLPMEFQRHVRQRGPDTSWNDMTKVYLRHVKLTFLKFAIWPYNQGLFGNHNESLLLSICAANFDSMHGRVAADFLNRRSSENSPVNLPVAISVLILLVGEEGSIETLDRFRNKNYKGCWEKLLGSFGGHPRIRRPPFPRDVATRAAQYLIENQVKWEDIASMINSESDWNDPSLMMELCLSLCRRGDKDSVFLAVRLVGRLFESLPTNTQAETTLEVRSIVVEVLKSVVDMGLADLEEMRATARRGGVLPLGVPVPFNRRQDFDQLLASHRQSQKRKHLKSDGAIEARKEAYRLVCLLPATIIAQQKDEPFELPILLLQCAVYEDRYLEHFVLKAIDFVLNACVMKLSTEFERNDDGDFKYKFQQQATMLLPSLLETVCSEDVSVRSVGLDWIKRLLIRMDGEAAIYLASHLVHDGDSTIARSARKLISDSNILFPIESVPSKLAKIVFHDMGASDQELEIRLKLRERVLELSASLNVSPEKCEKLLLRHEFSVPNVIATHQYKVDALPGSNDMRNKLLSSNENNSLCEICYEDVEVSSKYSLQCGHEFCTSCWSSYLSEASESKFSLLELRCPQHGCEAGLVRSDIQAICPSLLSKWDEYLLQCFIEQDPHLRYCPGADCQCVAIVDHSSPSLPHKITCDSCKTCFCFECGERPHDPATCEDYLAWKRLKESSRFWMKHHSKPCPGCRAPIEKNGGCNHVHCSSCETDFCWLCLGLLNQHLEAHNCNRYDPAESADDDFERRALFTATRFEAHDHAEDFAFEQLQSFRPEKLLEAFWFLEDEDSDVIQRGLETLVQARCFLKHSYIASLGLRDDQATLEKHETQHSCLEMFTERLSQLTEMNLHRLYLEQGQNGLRGHLQKLAFFTASVEKYQERMSFSRK